MNAFRLAASLALLGYAVALTGSLFLSVASLDRAVVGATALALLLGGAAASTATAKVAYMLWRYATTDRTDPADVASLPSGDHWIRVEGRANRVGAVVEPQLSADPAVAQSVEVQKRETLSGLPWPREPTTLVNATEARPFSVTDGVSRFRLAADECVRVVDSWREATGKTVGPNGDRLPESVVDFLDRHGHDADANLSDGVLFDHDLRVAEATVPDGETVRLFGRVTVPEDGDALEPRGDGTTGVVATTEPWRTIPARYLRDLLWGVLGAVVLSAGGAVLLGFLVGAI